MRYLRWPFRVALIAVVLLIIASCGSSSDLRRLCAIAGVDFDGTPKLVVGDDAGGVGFSADDGRSFHAGQSDTTTGISDFGASLSYDWGVGKNGWLGLRAGLKYEQFDTGVTEDLNDGYSFSGSNLTYVVGSKGHFGKFDGSTYLSASVGIELDLPDLYKIDCSTMMHCYAVGEGGAVYRTTDGGDNWEAQDSGTTEDLNSVFILDNRAWAVGNNGVLSYSVNFNDWYVHQDTGLSGNLNDLYFFNQNEGLVIGDNVYSTTDGGSNFQIELERSGALAFKKFLTGFRQRFNTFYMVGAGETLVEGVRVNGTYMFNELGYDATFGADSNTDDSGSGSIIDEIDTGSGSGSDSGSVMMGDDDDDDDDDMPRFVICYCDDGFGPVGENFICGDTGKTPTNCS